MVCKHSWVKYKWSDTTYYCEKCHAVGQKEANEIIVKVHGIEMVIPCVSCGEENFSLIKGVKIKVDGKDKTLPMCDKCRKERGVNEGK